MEKGSVQVATQDVLQSIVHFSQLDKLVELCRANSLWPMTFGLACCAIEMMATGASRFDLARFGAEVFRPSPRQSDVMIVTGTINKKMAPAVQTLYDQMPEPKWVIAMGNCAISGGPFVFEGQYNVVEGASKLFPVDVFIPGCPPRPEALIEGILLLEEKMTGTRRWPRVVVDPMPRQPLPPEDEEQGEPATETKAEAS
nr:NADH-quinone oxidoreductase subunit NuoB [Fundidesulfovibrio agrisoli]